AEEHLQNVPQVLQTLASEAAQEAAPDAQAREIGNRFRAQLEAAGASPQGAIIMERFFRTMAERTGMSPEELFQRFPVRVEGAEAVSREQEIDGDTGEPIEPDLDTPEGNRTFNQDVIDAK